MITLQHESGVTTSIPRYLGRDVRKKKTPTRNLCDVSFTFLHSNSNCNQVAQTSMKLDKAGYLGTCFHECICIDHLSKPPKSKFRPYFHESFYNVYSCVLGSK